MSELKQQLDLFINQPDFEEYILISYLIALFDNPINYTAIKQNKFTEFDLWRYLENYLRIRFNLKSEKFNVIKERTNLILKKDGKIDLLKLDGFQNSNSLYNKRYEISHYLYNNFKQTIDQIIFDNIIKFEDISKKILYLFIKNYPNKSFYSEFKQNYNFDENYIYYQDFIRDFKNLFNFQVSLDHLINTLIKSGLYKVYNNIISEFEFISEDFISKIIIEILESNVREEINQKTCKINKVLNFINEHGNFPSISDCIKNFDFEIEEAEFMLDTIKNFRNLNVHETLLLKEKAAEAIKQLKKITLFDLINTLNVDFDIGAQIGNYLINKSIIEDFPLVSKIKNKIFEEKIKIFISYAEEDSKYFKIPELGDYLQKQYPDIEILYYEKSLKLGEDTLDYMERGINWCNVFVWFHSKNSELSRAKDEYKMAYHLNKKIISITEDFNSLPLSAKVRWALKYNHDVILLANKLIKDIKSENFCSQIPID